MIKMKYYNICNMEMWYVKIKCRRRRINDAYVSMIITDDVLRKY